MLLKPVLLALVLARTAQGSFWVIYKGPELFFEAANLDPHQNYSFWVKAVNKEGSGQFSTHAYFKTKKGAPVRPEPPYVVARTNDSLTVRWNEPSNGGGHIHGYILAVQEDPKHQVCPFNVLPNRRNMHSPNKNVS